MTLSDLIHTAPTLDEHNDRIARTAQQDEPWGAIVSFDVADLPSFPTDIFPDWLRAFVEAEAEATQTPADLSGMLALAVLATCAQRWIMVEGRPGWIEPVNLFVVVALPPGSRKTAVFRAFTQPLLAYEQRQAMDTKRRIVDIESRRDIIEERLSQAKREAARAKSGDSDDAMARVDNLTSELRELEPPPVPRLIVDDVTPEALASLLVEQGGRMAALSAEGDVFAIMAGRYSGASGPNFGVFLKAHAGDTLRVDRRARHEYVDWPALTLGITTQPEIVRGLAEKAGFRGQGLLGRFLYALPTSLIGRRKIDPNPVPEGVRQDYHAHIAAILQWRELHSANSANSANSKNESLISYLDNITTLKISIFANTLLTQFLAWIEPQLGDGGAFGAFADWAGKLAGATLRIAGLLHIAELLSSHNSHNSQNTISEETLGRALRLTEYLIAHARAAFYEMGSDSAIAGARRALAWIEQRRMYEFTKRDLFEGIKGTIAKADDLDPILKALTDHGYIRPIEMGDRAGPGRKPSQRYETHPSVLNGSHNSHNSQNSLPVFSFILPDQVNGEQPDVDLDAVRQLLARGDEAEVRQQCMANGLDADLVIARARMAYTNGKGPSNDSTN